MQRSNYLFLCLSLCFFIHSKAFTNEMDNGITSTGDQSESDSINSNQDFSTEEGPRKSELENPCLTFTESITTNNCSNEWECNLLERKKMACRLRDQLLKKYSLIHQKESRITDSDSNPFNSEQHLNKCVIQELSINNNSHLRFIDRMRECVAGFKDTHLSLDSVVPLPLVYLPIGIKEINNKFYISMINKMQLEWIDKRSPGAKLVEKLKFGSEILSVDGKSPEEWIKRYSKFISGSSENYIRLAATASIFSRNFDYPTKRNISLIIADKAGRFSAVSIPWWVSSSYEKRKDTLEYFTRLGIGSSSSINLNYNKFFKRWEILSVFDQDKYSFSHRFTIVPKSERSHLETYYNEDKIPALRKGIITPSQGKSVCYMQLLTFHAQKLTLEKNSPKFFIPFIEPIANFIQICEEKKLPLIFDLRKNNGGFGMYPPALMSILTENNKQYPNAAQTFRTTDHIGKIIGQFRSDSFMKAYNLLDFEADIDQIYASYVWAREDNNDYTPIFFSADIGPSLPQGYNQKIVTLITPRCISACDKMAALLKRSGRATLIGSPTNGTGAGFISLNNISPNITIDDTLSINIPNYIFGVADKSYLRDGLVAEHNEEMSNKILLENRPTSPDIPYRTTKEELLGSLNGWWNTAMNVLFTPLPSEKI